MALSRIAAEFAAEIKLQNWLCAPYRADRAGHDHLDHERRCLGPNGKVLSQQEADTVRLNVMWVTAQVLAYNDPNFNEHDFAEACGVNARDIRNRDGRLSGVITYGLRFTSDDGSTPRRFDRPGTYSPDEPEPIDQA